MKATRVLFVAFLIVLLCIPAVSASAREAQIGGTAAMNLSTFSPNPALVGFEANFDLVFNVSGVNPGVGGAEVYLGYNPALVAPPLSPMGVAEGRPDFFGVSNVSINELLPAASCPGGTMPCVHLVLAGPAQVTQTGVAARFHFRALAEGSACFSILQSGMVDADGFAVTHTKGPDACVNIVFRVVPSGTVLRQGVVASPNPGGGTLGCSSIIANQTAPAVASFGPVNTDTLGKFVLPSVPVGTFNFTASYPGYLSALKTGLVFTTASPTSYNLGTITLRGGDVNGDNAINILDIGSIISKFGRSGVGVESSTTSCLTLDEAADLNDDGLINISDLAIAAGNWGSTGPAVWP